LKIARLFTLFISLLCALPIAGNPTQKSVLLSELEAGYQRALPRAKIHSDPSRQVSYRDMDSLWQQNQFKSPTNDKAGQGLSPHHTWVRFELHNDQITDKNIVIEYIDHALPYLDLYSRESNYPILTHHGQRSTYAPAQNNSGSHTRFYYSQTLKVGETRIFYARLSFDNITPIYPDFRIWDAGQFDDFKYREAFFLGTFFGYLTLIFATGLLLMMLFRESYWLSFSAFILTTTGAWGSATGFWPTIFFTEGFHWKYSVICAALSIVSGAMFTRQLLATRQHLPRFDWSIVALMLFGTIPVIASLIGNSAIAVPSLQLHIIGVGLLMVAGYLRANQGDSTAIFFTIIWSLYVIALTIHPMKILGIIDNDLITYWLGPYLISLGVILLLVLTLYRSMKRH
jgi:hypothetical protein